MATGRTVSQVIDKLKAAPMPDLRRVQSEPLPAGRARQLFTDRTLERLTSATAAPEAVSSAEPVALLPFGADPAPRPGAGPRPGQCGVCLEDKPETVQMCWNTGCATRFCEECIRGFAKEAVDRALYAVPWLHCPGCQGRVPTSAWSGRAPEAYDTYTSNAAALLTFRCSDCHEVGSLVCSYAEDPKALDSLPPEAAAKVCQAWPAFAYAASQPEAILDLLPGGNPSSLLPVIADLERRTCLHLAWLRQQPFISTPCCDSEFCFKCKVGSHHEGQTCEERQREELDIECQFCPECEVPTVRTEGCDHIVCVCGNDWTWQEYKEAGQALGPVAFLREILGRGALDPCWANRDDGSGRTLVMYAVLEGRLENVRLLVEAAADVNARDDRGHSALLYAFGSINGVHRPECQDLLIEQKARVDKADPFVWMKSAGSNDASLSPCALTRLLELSGSSAGDKDNGASLLQCCLQAGGRVALVRDLLDNRGLAPEPLAPFWFLGTGQARDLALLDRLLEASGLGIDDRGPGDSKTLVQVAMGFNNQDIVRHLIIKHGAMSSLGELARPAGQCWPNGAVVPMDLFDALVRRGARVWEPGPGDGGAGWLLVLAVGGIRYANDSRSRVRQNASKPVVEAFLQRLLGLWDSEADCFARTPQGSSCLAEAAAQGAWQAVRRLAEAGADPRTRDGQGRTMLHLAVEQAQKSAKPAEAPIDNIEFLLKARADALAVHSGVTALQAAEKFEWRDACALLRAAADEQSRVAAAVAEKAAKSGDGTVANVGIKTDGAVKCPECNQVFDSQRAQQSHWRFIHDPTRHQED